VLPAVALTHPGEFAAVEPLQVRVGIDPGFIALDKERAQVAHGEADPHHGVGVLQAVELLEEHFSGVVGPVHPGDVVVARIAGHLRPPNA